MSATSCKSGFQRIDERVDTMIAQRSNALGPDAVPPAKILPPAPGTLPFDSDRNPGDEHPTTVNPSADDLPFVAIKDADNVLARLDAYSTPPPGVDALRIDLNYALGYAPKASREYQFAQEQYVLTALRLLIERHLWGPRFFDDVSATVVGVGNDGMFDTALQLVNEFGVVQRLPFGGEVSASLLARATQDLHHRVAGENVQNAEFLLRANVPLLRGAGLSESENLIQAERNLVYAARDYEQFRRQFFFEIARDFLNLVVQQQSVANAERQVWQLKEVEDRERSLYEAGRTPRFQAALAEQATVSALDTLHNRREAYRLLVDRFKLRLGIPVEQPVEIDPSSFALPIPETSIDEAVRLAMAYRLDLQTQRDRVDDARRLVDVARNNLLPDLNLIGSVSVPTDPYKRRSGLDFAGGDTVFRAGAVFSLPLDREIERINVRQSQIQLERQNRESDRLRDSIALDVRSAVRDIDLARYTLRIQEESVAIGEERRESIDAAPDRATARDASDAANELLRAKDRRDAAARDLQVAILRYLLETGQLRVDSQGFIRPLRGMTIGGQNPAPDSPDETEDSSQPPTPSGG